MLIIKKNFKRNINFLNFILQPHHYLVALVS